MKIGLSSGQQAMLIINADLRLLFSELRELASPEEELYLGDEKGDFLMHPDEGATFGSDLGYGVRFEAGKTEARLMVEREVPTGQWPERVLFLRVKFPDAVWRATLEQSKQRGIWAIGWATFAGAVLALLIAWPFAHRLGSLSKALRLFDGTGEVPSQAFGDPRHDEIGVAIEQFREMAAKVSEYVEDLHRARHEAEEANAAKETFLAVMSHEIRTPMNAVVGLIRALEANDPPARQEPILNSLRSSTDNLMTLLNTALDFTRLQESVMSFAEEDFDAALVARDVVATLKPLAMTKNLVIDFEAPTSLPVQGDPVRLRQVMNNLLNNALKFTGEGSVCLSLTYEDGELVGRVRDTGPGICEKDRERIFTPFFTRETGLAASGAGLGLSVSKGILEQQGGSLFLESSSGSGACFVFTLPYRPGTIAGEETSDRAEASVRGFPEGLRLLYVEDTPSNQEVMSLTLEGTGMELRCVGTAGEAFTEFDKGRYDLVMVDLQLPDMSGAELARRLRERAPGLPIIAVTAQSSAVADGLLRDAGIREVILKPYAREQVIKTLSRVLPGDPAASLAVIHPNDPGKAARLGKMMAREFQESAEEIRMIEQAGTDEEKREVLRAVRHRLTTALALFPLERVEQAFTEVDSAGISDRSGFAELVAALEEAAELLSCDRRKGMAT
jgi:signal transduction histidine kinase